MSTTIESYTSHHTTAAEALDASMALRARPGSADAALNPFLEDEQDEETYLTDPGYERFMVPIFVKKGSTAYTEYSEPVTARPRKAKKSYGGEIFTADDQTALAFLAKFGIATAEQLSYLYTTTQKTEVTRGTDGSIQRTTSKTGGEHRIVKVKTAYIRMKRLEENGFVFSKRYGLGTVWSITREGLAQIQSLMAELDTVDLKRLQPTGMSGDQIPHRLMISQVAAGILSEATFFKKNLGLKHIPETLTDLIVDREIDSWKATQRNLNLAQGIGGTRAEKLEHSESMSAWRQRVLAQRVQGFKNGDVLPSELLSERALWASGFWGSLVNPTAKERTFDLVMNRERYRSSLAHMSLAFEVERSPKRVDAYRVWLNTFAAELKLEGGPYARVYIVPAGNKMKEITSALREADRLRALELAGVPNSAGSETKAEAIKRFGLLGANKPVRIVPLTRLDGTPYNPDERF